ncbi:MAG: ankyrin repeat domain-containing protein [Dokdonella sp.]|uniref:ankyrin repeat domain-containing protein n=1 Tax=Dokdonella sp. TaxID=2291710 RepID=UPI003F7FC197
MTRLPQRPDLDQLRKQAKELLAAYRAGERDAFDRLRASLPAAQARDDAAIAALGLRLHDAQSCLAREYGFPSWAQLKQYVETHATDVDASERLRRWTAWTFGGGFQSARPHLAARLLHEHPRLLDGEPLLACAVGDVATVRACLAADPRWVNTRGEGWTRTPLVAACFSAFVRLPEFAVRVREVVALLLAAGANPNDATEDAEFPGDSLSVLYAAAGRNHDPALTRMLLDAGANPDDNESLYHAVEGEDIECVRLLLAAGARVSGTNAILRVVDFERPDCLRLLLAHGGDPNEPTGDGPLPHALRRRRSAAVVKILLDAGADPNARNAHGVPALKIARHMGLAEVAALLREAGAVDAGVADERERFVVACASGDRATATAILARQPHIVAGLDEMQRRLLPELAANGAGEGVRLMVELGWPIAARGGDIGGSALNWAVFRGDSALAAFLLAHGASCDERHDYDDDVYGTLSFASLNRPDGPGDWLGCAQALIAAGSPMPDLRYSFAEDIAAYFETLRPS